MPCLSTQQLSGGTLVNKPSSRPTLTRLPHLPISSTPDSIFDFHIDSGGAIFALRLHDIQYYSNCLILYRAYTTLLASPPNHAKHAQAPASTTHAAAPHAVQRIRRSQAPASRPSQPQASVKQHAWMSTTRSAAQCLACPGQQQRSIASERREEEMRR